MLVTGATGFLARHVVAALAGDNAEVRSTARGSRPSWLDPVVGYLPADLTAEVPGELLEGVTHVIHLAGASSSRSTEDEMRLVNVTGTAHLAQAILRHAPMARLVHVSSTSVYGEQAQLPLPVREDGPLLPSRPYGKTKLEGEQEVLDATGKGLRAVIVRPVTVFGAFNTKLLASAILDASLERAAGSTELVLGAEPVSLRIVHAADAARAFVHLGLRCGDEVLGRAFNLSLPEFPTSHEVGAAIARALAMTPLMVEDGTPPLEGAERQAAWQGLVDAGSLVPEILLSARRLQFLTRPNPNNALSLDALTATGFNFQHTDLDLEVAGLASWFTEHRWII